MQCVKCGRDILTDAVFCHWCGHQLQARCQRCESPNPAGSAFCHSCGAVLSSRLDTPSQEQALESSPAHQAPRAAQCPRCARINEPGAAYCYRCGFSLEASRPAGADPPGIPAYREGRPAGFWVRLAAYLIDGIVLSTGWLVLVRTLGDGTFEADSVGEYFANLALSAAYFTLLVAAWGTTIGKRVFSMYVVHSDGSRVSPLRSLARALAQYVSAATLFIGFIMIGVRKDKRGLHDLICDTVVVIKDRPSRSGPP